MLQHHDNGNVLPLGASSSSQTPLTDLLVSGFPLRSASLKQLIVMPARSSMDKEPVSAKSDEDWQYCIKRASPLSWTTVQEPTL